MKRSGKCVTGAEGLIRCYLGEEREREWRFTRHRTHRDSDEKELTSCCLFIYLLVCLLGGRECGVVVESGGKSAYALVNEQGIESMMRWQHEGLMS